MVKRDKKGRFEKQETPITLFNDYAVVHTNTKDYRISLDKVDLVKQYKWSEDTTGYAKCQSIKMHRLILNAQKGQIVDHINQDKTDNRTENLRFVSHSLNIRNSNISNSITGHKHILKKQNKYYILIRCRGIRYYKNGFTTLEEAIKYRNGLYEEIRYFEE